MLLNNMIHFLVYLPLVFLTGSGKVQCAGQFFQITKDNRHMKMEEPVLTADVFECGREKACTTLIRNVKSTGDDVEASKAAFTIRKTTGCYCNAF